MSNIIYEVTEDTYLIDGEPKQIYGIAVYSNDKSNTQKTLLKSIRDITTDKYRLSKLAQACNSCHLSPIHLKDIVEDFLYD